MKTRTNQPVELLEVGDVKQLTGEQIDGLECGDIVVKKDNAGKHSYVVTYKKDKVGICLTYGDASVIETQSYDYVDGNWVYNGEDKTPNLLNAQTEDDVIGLLGSGDVPSIKGDEIIENMSGYSFYLPPNTDWTKNIAYAGVVKNGNKITFVVCGNVSKTANAGSPDFISLGKFTIPSSIADKLFPISGTIIDYRFQDWFVSLGDSLNVRVYTEKDTSTSINMIAFANPTLDKVYNFRYELTFLLSDNLAQ